MAKKVEPVNNPNIRLECLHLAEAIDTGNENQARESLKKLIPHRVQVKVTFKKRRAYCNSHNFYFPGEHCIFEKTDLTFSQYCQYAHGFCYGCIKAYVQENYNSFKFQWNFYQCIFCQYHGVPDTLLLTYDQLINTLIDIYGSEAVNSQM